MTTQEFIDGYKKSQKKEDFVKKHITNQYVSYFLKQARAQKMVELTTTKEVNGRKVYWQDSPALFQLFIARLIGDYTDINLGEDSADSFDKLNEAGLIEQIVAAIPEQEYKEYNTLVQMCQGDALENLHSVSGYLDTKLEALEIMFNALAENQEIREAVAEKIVEFPGKSEEQE